MFLLILESLGSTELAFILVMALIFFGPRKLPQLSRTIGKNLASFRRASEDFKRTWEKEVSMEELNLSRIEQEAEAAAYTGSLNQNETADNTISPTEAEPVIPRHSKALESSSAPAQPVEPTSKRDWL